MKKPRDVADAIRSRQEENDIVRETIRIPRLQARKRAKQVFRQFPTATYLTEIETWKILRNSDVELTVKRLRYPMEGADKILWFDD
jgi:hypothetical protein